MTQPSVLVVDDEENFLELLDRILSREGYQVTTASDGVQALVHADRESFRLAILDVKMQPISGIEILAELKKRDPTTQVLMISAYPTEETRNECIKLGAAGYLTKPIEMSELKSVLRYLMGADLLLQGH
jgi:DNA-binding response OmpR family regulator